MFPSRFRLQPARLRQAIALAMVGMLVLCTLGLPLPLSVAFREFAQQAAGPMYPCMNCPCGCTAESCWKNCCCYTEEQKLAWARENGVTPPDYVLAAAKPCCGKSCCSKAPAAKPSCCAAKSQPQQVAPENNLVLMLQALRCQGLESFWTLLPPTTPPQARLWLDFRPNCEGWVSLDEVLFQSISDAPEVPPPRGSIG